MSDPDYTALVAQRRELVAKARRARYEMMKFQHELSGYQLEIERIDIRISQDAQTKLEFVENGEDK